MNNIKFLGKCPFCGKKYDKDKVRVMEKYEHLSVVYAQCVSCASASMLAVTVGTMGMVTTVGVLTDFQEEDLERFSDCPPISADDVLEAHHYLKKF